MLRTLINQRLGRYTIVELLGRGGMAAVYRASDSALKRDVALKVLYPQYSDDQSLVERFTREAITAAALEHPHIVPVYDVDEQDGMAYIAMKLLSGETLQDRLQRDGPLDVADLCAILRPVAEALDYAHSRGVIHRDIKPGNIFLSQSAGGQPQVMLTDFGIAKRLDTPGLTTTGALIGTPDYMAPEQIAGRPVDARTDVYALGMLAYRALTGRRAFEGGAQDVLMGHLYQQPPPPSSVAPGLPAALDQVVLRAIATSPADRFPSAGAFARALDQVAGATAVGVAPALQAQAAGPPTSINSAPTAVNAAPRVARPQPVGPQSLGVQPAVTHTTVAPTGVQVARAEPRGSAAPWVLAVILALLAGGLAVAIGFLLNEGRAGQAAGGSGAGAGPSPSPTPSVTAVPTLPATLTPAASAVAGGEASPTPEPSPTSAPAPTATSRVGATPAPAATATATASPAPSDTPSATATITASDTPTPTSTDTPTPTVACDDSVLQGGFGRLYRDDVGVRTRIGCPQSGEQAGKGSEQFFSKGAMFYWGLNQSRMSDTIVVFYGLNEGTYAIVDADEAASYPEAPPSDDVNAPVRGFGRVYYGKPGVAEALEGWTSPEIELNGNSKAVIQFFDKGTMIYTPFYRQSGAQAIFVLYADGAFERYNDPPAS